MPTAQATLDAIGDAVISTDAAGRVTYLNPAAERLTGWPQAAAAGRPSDEVLHLVDPRTQARIPSPLLRAMADDTAVALPAHCLLFHRDGRSVEVEDSATPVRDAAGAIVGAVIVFRSVGTSLAHARQMTHIAMHDPLTGLPNRRLLLDRLEVALASAVRRRQSVAVGFLDIIGFKAINDGYGHATGDQLLQAIGARLQAAIRTSDTVCRYGGDEFVVVLADLGDARHLPRLASTMRRAGTGPYRIDGHAIDVSLSLGLALAPRDGSDAASLIAHADAAMYATRAGQSSARAVRNETDLDASAP